MPRRKIAFVHPDLGIGGAERLVLDVASAIVKHGDEVIFLTNHFSKNHAFEELKRGDFPVQVYGDWLPRSICGRFQALCAYIRMLYLTLVYLLTNRSRDNPDIFFVDLIPVAVPILKLFKQKVVYYCHHPDLLASESGGTLKKFYRMPIDWVEMKSTKHADVILVNSEYTASVFRETFPEIKKPIQVLYPTVALSYLETLKTMKNPRQINEIVPEISSDAKSVFLSINRFHPAKKLDLALLAMENLKQMVPAKEWKNTFLILAGGYDPESTVNANYFKRLTTLVEEKNLQNNIFFLKSPSDDVKAELLLSCDCLVYTPVKEHFGIVPLEAMTASKPVIACNSGGPRETVTHGHTGYLCEPDAGSLAQFMFRILRTNTKDMGAKGHEVLQKKFSYESFAKKLKTIINNINVNKK